MIDNSNDRTWVSVVDRLCQRTKVPDKCFIRISTSAIFSCNNAATNLSPTMVQFHYLTLLYKVDKCTWFIPKTRIQPQVASWCININNQLSGKEKAAPVRTRNVWNSIVNASLAVNTVVLTAIAPIVKTTAKMRSNVLKPYPISWIETLTLSELKLQIIK